MCAGTAGAFLARFCFSGRAPVGNPLRSNPLRGGPRQGDRGVARLYSPTRGVCLENKVSWTSFFGAIELGLIYAPVAIGVLISFRFLDFPDLTVDGTFPLGAAVTGVLIADFATSAPLAMGLSVLAGMAAGFVTAFLNQRFNILHLLASILVMIALFSVNLRVMGRPNIPLFSEWTLVSWLKLLPIDITVARIGLLGVFVFLMAVGLIWYLHTESGLAMRATGLNRRMAQSQGVQTRWMIYGGMAVSNGLVALGGSLFAQWVGFADATIGAGTIILGLAAVILGETLFRARSVLMLVLAAIVGAVLYRLAVAWALSSDWLGFRASDLNFVTALLVALALILPHFLKQLRLKKTRGSPGRHTRPF